MSSDSRIKIKLFVRSLDFNTTQSTIEDYFSQYGSLSEVIMRYNDDGRSKGFCFVVFNEEQAMEEVLKREHEIDGRKVEVKRAGVGSDSQTNKLFCGGLPHALTEDQLREYFTQYGEVRNFEFIYDPNTQERKHFCFVLFKDSSSVDKIVEGKMPPGSVVHHISTYRVECKKKFDDEHPIELKVRYPRSKFDGSVCVSDDCAAVPSDIDSMTARGGARGRGRGRGRGTYPYRVECDCEKKLEDKHPEVSDGSVYEPDDDAALPSGSDVGPMMARGGTRGRGRGRGRGAY
jgi:RNA recognition motif-containing protein